MLRIKGRNIDISNDPKDRGKLLIWKNSLLDQLQGLRFVARRNSASKENSRRRALAQTEF
jgi:hypothetical protein